MNPFSTPAPSLLPNPYDEAEMARIRERSAAIDPLHTHTILDVGKGTQNRLNTLSTHTLHQVGTGHHDTGNVLRTIVDLIHELAPTPTQMRDTPTFWERLLGRSTPKARLVLRFASLRPSLDSAIDSLLRHDHLLTRAALTMETTVSDAQAIPRALAHDIATLLAVEENLPKTHPAAEVVRERIQDLSLSFHIAKQSADTAQTIQNSLQSLAIQCRTLTTHTLPVWETAMAQALALPIGPTSATIPTQKPLSEIHDTTVALLEKSLTHSQTGPEYAPG